MLAGEVSSQSFQTVPGRRREIGERRGVVELNQFPASDPRHIGRKPLRNAPLLKNQRRERAAEASDHRSTVSRHDTNTQNRDNQKGSLSQKVRAGP
jgi:hypothetical protein